MADVSEGSYVPDGSYHTKQRLFESLKQLSKIESAVSEIARQYGTTVDSLYEKSNFYPKAFIEDYAIAGIGHGDYTDMTIEYIKNVTESSKNEAPNVGNYQRSESFGLDKILKASKITAAGSLALFAAGAVAEDTQQAYADSEDGGMVTIPADLYRELQIMCNALFPGSPSDGEIRKSYVPFDASGASVMSSSSTLATSSDTKTSSGDGAQTLINANVDVSSSTSPSNGVQKLTSDQEKKSGGHMTMEPSEARLQQVEECDGLFCSISKERLDKILNTILGEQERAEETRDDMWKDLYSNKTDDE